MPAVWWAAGMSISEASWQGVVTAPLEDVSIEGTAETAAMASCICNLVAAVARPDP